MYSPSSSLPSHKCVVSYWYSFPNHIFIYASHVLISSTILAIHFFFGLYLPRFPSALISSVFLNTSSLFLPKTYLLNIFTGTHVEQGTFFGHLGDYIFGTEYRHQVQPLDLHLSPFLQRHVHADYGSVPFTHLVRHGLGERRPSNRDRLDYMVVQYGLHAV